MKVLILGASGATGKLVVTQLYRRNIHSRIVARINAPLPEEFLHNQMIEIVRGNISEFDDPMNVKLIEGCDAVVCCLGHNITFKGLFGIPRMLVTGTVKNMCEAIINNSPKKVKLILMNTTAHISKASSEQRLLKERIILSILKVLLPPHKDNVSAADYLSRDIGRNNSNIEWVAVRPDTLIDQETESPYDVVESPTRSPIFNPGKTSRINVSRFIAELLIDEKLWQRWKYTMPVVYNKEEDNDIN